MVEQVNEILADADIRLLDGPVDGYKWPRFERGLPQGKQDFLFDCFNPKVLEQLGVPTGKKMIAACTVDPNHETPDEVAAQIRDTLAGIIARGPGALKDIDVGEKYIEEPAHA